MSDQPKDAPLATTKDIVTTVTTTVGAVSAALVVTPTMPLAQTVVIAGLTAFLPNALAMACEAHTVHVRRRAQRFWNAVTAKWAQSDGTTAEEIAGILEAHKDEPHVNETIWRSIRALMEAADDAATIPLSVLAQEYLQQKIKPDRFFRGAVLTLQELQHSEMLELRGMLKWALDVPAARTICIIADYTNGSWTLIRETLPPKEDDGMRSVYREQPIPCTVAEPDRILNLMQRSGIAVASIGHTPPTTNTALVRDYAERLYRLLAHVEN